MRGAITAVIDPDYDGSRGFGGRYAGLPDAILRQVIAPALPPPPSATRRTGDDLD